MEIQIANMTLSNAIKLLQRHQWQMIKIKQKKQKILYLLNDTGNQTIKIWDFKG